MAEHAELWPVFLYVHFILPKTEMDADLIALQLFAGAAADFSAHFSQSLDAVSVPVLVAMAIEFPVFGAPNEKNASIFGPLVCGKQLRAGQMDRSGKRLLVGTAHPASNRKRDWNSN